MGYEDSIGLEISPEQYEECTKNGANVVLTEDSHQYLIDNSDKYDVVMAFDLIEHIEKEKQIPFVKAIYKSLKINGTFICTVPNANSVVGMRYRYIDWTHQIAFTEESMDFLLYNSNFAERMYYEVGRVERPRIIS